ncbi:DUF2142 domain-containing protein [Acidisoma silvae]|uniref:DUF2142 domain-containing protein n=1 Tax=Acidisoma silvae TaxID=2802396 RepID=A0A963YT02_9PROT|nr:DUF2142 domain-containing protein [Acidisoma silvae]MCB8876471.1 DUF2142 domain-containing protein [Acidisoma silvae]
MSKAFAFRTVSEDRPRSRQPAGQAPSLHLPGQMSQICVVIFLTLVVPLGIILAFVTPLGGVADETAHALRAESLSHGDILGFRALIHLPDGSPRIAAGVLADPGIAAAATVRGPGDWVTSDRMRAARAAQWQGQRSFAEITPLALYMPVFYVPAALTIAGIRLIDLRPADAFLAARLVNFAIFAVIGMLALTVARRGHAILLCTLALPMEVSLAASLNQDGLLIAVTVLAVALLTRHADEPTSSMTISPAWIAAAALLGLVALAKIPYAGLLLLPVFPLAWSRACRLRLMLAALCAVPALGWAAYAMAHIATPWPPLPPYHAGPLWPGATHPIFTSPDSAAQVKVLAARPWRIVTLTLQSLWAKKAILLEFIGILGFVSVRLPSSVYALWGLALLSAAIADRKGSQPSGFGTRDQCALAVMLGLIVIAIYMSQYLSWTPVGFPIVIGPTGRYFLPLLPATVVLIPRLPLPAVLGRGIFLLPLVIAAIVSLIVTPLCVLDAFYAP